MFEAATDNELMQVNCLIQMLMARKLFFKIFPDGTLAFMPWNFANVSDELWSSIRHLKPAFARFYAIAQSRGLVPA